MSRFDPVPVPGPTGFPVEARRAILLAQVLALASAAALVVSHFTSATPAPTPLFLLFVGLWIFGVAMMRFFPRFGTLGTFAWGALAGFGIARMHGLDRGLVIIAILSFAAAAGAGYAFTEILKKPKAS